MNTTHRFLYALSLIISLSTVFYAEASNPKYEMRAVWFTTLSRIDWPNTTVRSSTDQAGQEAQKKEMRDLLDKLQACRVNSFCIQVRPTADAYYKSSYEPWASYLSGTRGLDPGYDPLQYAIEEGHKRGMEVHVWVNPFRYEVSAGSYGDDDPLRKAHPDWLIAYHNGSYNGTIIDPGIPDARKYVVDVLMEIVNNYDIQGIIMDDYFYPYGGTTTEDAVSKSTYKPADMDDTLWRVDNVNQTMKLLYDSIQTTKPWVRFGMGTFGIWTTQSAVASRYGLTLPRGIVGLDDYQVQFCNPIDWVIGGYVDYLAPQLYWSTYSAGQDYDVLCQWWAQTVKSLSDKLDDKRVHFYVSHAAYRDFSTEEIFAQIDDNREMCPYNAPGSIFYNTKNYLSAYSNQLASTRYSEPALLPPMDWKTAPTLSAPTDLKIEDTTLSWSHPSAARFTLYAFPTTTTDKTIEEILSDSKYLIGMVWDTAYDIRQVQNYWNKTFVVCAYDAYGNEYAPAVITPDISTHIAVTGIKILTDSIIIGKGQFDTIRYEIFPANATVQDVTWSVSDPDIIMVQDGVLTGLEQGIAMVTVKTDDGDFTATCSVRVRVPVAGVSLRVKTATLNIGDTKRLVATVVPAAAADKSVVWHSENEGVATITQEGTITAIGAGETDIIVTTNDGGFTATCHVTVNGFNTDIDDIHQSVSIIKTEAGIYISCDIPTSVQIFSVMGELLLSKNLVTQLTAELPQGVYVVTVGSTTYKIIK